MGWDGMVWYCEVQFSIVSFSEVQRHVCREDFQVGAHSADSHMCVCVYNDVVYKANVYDASVHNVNVYNARAYNASDLPTSCSLGLNR